MSRGSTANIDPEAWAIVEGKLYLNYNKKIQKLWMEDQSVNIEQADKNWPGVLDQ